MRKQFSWLQTLVLLVVLMVARGALAEEVPESVKGALCLLRADDKLVMVDETLTGKLSLPGGTIERGEKPALTAQRETWEETGLVVTVGERLGYTDTAVIYSCVTDSDVISYRFKNSLGGYELPVWFAPHYGVEISSAMLIDPEEVIPDAYRYSEQWQTIRHLFSGVENQPVAYVSDLIQAAPEIHQTELHWLITLQKTVQNLPVVLSRAAHEFLLLGIALEQPAILLLILPLVFWMSGRAMLLKVLFALSVTSLLALVAQQGFSLPRPHVYLPSVELISSYGYGFPSLPVAVMSCLALVLSFGRDRHHPGRETALVVLLLLWISTSEFYSASAFLTDIAAGILLGGMVAWHIIRMDVKRKSRAESIFESWKIWLVLTIISGGLVTLWPQPVFAMWAIILLFVCLLTLKCDLGKTSLSFGKMVTVIAMLLISYEALSYVAGLVDFSSQYSLMIDLLRYPILMFLFSSLVMILPAREPVQDAQ